MPELSGPAITALRTRQRFTEGDLSAYITKGGNYVLATSGAYSDDGKARDLLLILPVDLGKGRLIRLWPALHPQFVPSIEEALRPTCEFSLRCRTRRHPLRGPCGHGRLRQARARGWPGRARDPAAPDAPHDRPHRLARHGTRAVAVAAHRDRRVETVRGRVAAHASGSGSLSRLAGTRDTGRAPPPRGARRRRRPLAA